MLSLPTREVVYFGFVVVVCFVFNTLLIHCWKFGSPYLGKATAAARAVLPIPTSVCSIFVCVRTAVWLLYVSEQRYGCCVCVRTAVWLLCVCPNSGMAAVCVRTAVWLLCVCPNSGMATVCVRTAVWLPAFGIFNMHTYIAGCHCPRGLYGQLKIVYTES